MASKSKTKRKYSPPSPHDIIDDDGIDDPDFDPENPEECIDMKVVFTEKYKYKPAPKIPKTCIGSVCTFFKQIYTNIFIDKSLCSHDKVKEFFGDEYKTIYKLKDTDFKESILTLLKTCRPGSKNNILYNNLYVTLLENVSVSEEKGSDLKIFNNDNRYTSNLFFNIYVNLSGKIVFRDIWKFDIKKQYIIQVVIPGHIFCIALIFDTKLNKWNIIVIDTTSSILYSAIREKIYEYIVNLLKTMTGYDSEVKGIYSFEVYKFQKFETDLIKENNENHHLLGLCQLWAMLNIFYFMRDGIDKVRSNYGFFIDLLKDESIKEEKDRYKIMICILYTWCLHHLHFTRRGSFFKSLKKSKPKKSKTKKIKPTKSMTKKTKPTNSKLKKSKTKKAK
jgi:hypothetical protein